MSFLEDMTLVQLRELAKEKSLANYSKMKKSELIESLSIQSNIDAQECRQEENKEDYSVKSVVSELALVENSKKQGELYVDENHEISGGVLEILPDGYGFLRGGNYLSTENDVYMSPTQIRRFRMKTGDYVTGIVRPPKEGDRFRALLYVHKINGELPEKSLKRASFDSLTAYYSKEKFNLQKSDDIASRLIDIIAPIGKGQRGLIVAPPKGRKDYAY